MEGIVVGGNIRCLLKLAGTPYWPDMRGENPASGVLWRKTAADGDLFKPVEPDGGYLRR